MIMRGPTQFAWCYNNFNHSSKLNSATSYTCWEDNESIIAASQLFSIMVVDIKLVVSQIMEQDEEKETGHGIFRGGANLAGYYSYTIASLFDGHDITAFSHYPRVHRKWCNWRTGRPCMLEEKKSSVKRVENKNRSVSQEIKTFLLICTLDASSCYEI